MPSAIHALWRVGFHFTIAICLPLVQSRVETARQWEQLSRDRHIVLTTWWLCSWNFWAQYWHFDTALLLTRKSGAVLSFPSRSGVSDLHCKHLMKMDHIPNTVSYTVSRAYVSMLLFPSTGYKLVCLCLLAGKCNCLQHHSAISPSLALFSKHSISKWIESTLQELLFPVYFCRQLHTCLAHQV
jgi:hypothetical protein